MINTIIILLCFVFLLIIGFIRQLKSIVDLKNNNDFAITYKNEFIAYIESRGSDNNKYQYLISNSNKMQRMLGRQGLASIKPPFASYIINDYAIIVNGIPDIKRLIDANLSGLTINGYIQFVIDALTRYLGDIENEKSIYLKSLYNPIKWFLSGIRLIFGIPIFILSSLEIFSINTQNKIINSVFYKLVTGTFALVGFISSLVTVIIGWDQFYQIVSTVCAKK